MICTSKVLNMIDRPIGKIDVHAHLLPGVDDGCANCQESIACARILVEAGYTHAFCTPHVWPDLPHNNVLQIEQCVHDLQAELDRAHVKLQLLSGGEMNLLSLAPGIMPLAKCQIVTYRMAGEYALFDFWAELWSDAAEVLMPVISHLQGQGLKLVLAHPERIAAVQCDDAVIDCLADMGVLLQLNSWTLTEPKDSANYRTAVRLLTEDRYFVIGTDLHKANSMAKRIDGLKVAEKLTSAGTVERLTITNPRKLAGL